MLPFTVTLVPFSDYYFSTNSPLVTQDRIAPRDQIAYISFTLTPHSQTACIPLLTSTFVAQPVYLIKPPYSMTATDTYLERPNPCYLDEILYGPPSFDFG